MLWVADSTDQALLEIDPSDGSVKRTLSLDLSPSSLAFGDGTIWAASYESGAVEQVDPSSGQTLDTVHVGNGPADLTFGLGAIWVANSLDGTLSRIDPNTVAVSATIPVGNGPSALAIGGDAVWTADEYSGSVSRIDPRRNVTTARVSVGGRPASLAIADRRLWVGDAAQGQTHRGGTLRLLTTTGGQSIDPAFYDAANPPESVGLAYDGLVTFERAAGPDGLRVVPDLAEQIPEPSNDGSTYTFHVRPGIHYSDGRLLRAGDFRRALERDFRVGSPAIGLFSNIVGARGCLRHAASCSLARGVVTDDTSGTVTIYLTAPDPVLFLFKLTEYAYTVLIPPGTPDRVVGGHSVPGTGPYRVASVSSRGIRFARNPFFREWSHAAQPDGNPDAIVVSYSPSHAATVAAIVAGKADWTFDLIPPAELQALELRHPALLQSNPALLVEFLPLNTHAPPFNDVRVRRALNLALDRRRIVDMYGGPTVAAPACQPLTPGIPGYRRYCPYTRDPRPDGEWSAPDLNRARQLVAASGTRGERIDVWGTTDEVAVPRQEPAYFSCCARSDTAPASTSDPTARSRSRRVGGSSSRSMATGRLNTPTRAHTFPNSSAAGANSATATTATTAWITRCRRPTCLSSRAPPAPTPRGRRSITGSPIKPCGHRRSISTRSNLCPRACATTSSTRCGAFSPTRSGFADGGPLCRGVVDDQDVAVGAMRHRVAHRRAEQALQHRPLAGADDDQIGRALVGDGHDRRAG